MASTISVTRADNGLSELVIIAAIQSISIIPAAAASDGNNQKVDLPPPPISASPERGQINYRSGATLVTVDTQSDIASKLVAK